MRAGDIEDIYELSPLQQGILFHSLYDGDTDIYINQRSFLIDGPLDPDALVAACQQAVAAHTALRTSFHWEGLDKPLQVVHREVATALTRHDWIGAGDEQERFDRLLAEDLATGFQPSIAPLQRLHLVQFGERRYGLVWTHHVLLLDGWSVPIFINDVMRRYGSLTLGAPPPEAAPPYRDYIAWLQRQDLDAAKDFWVRALAGRSGGGLAPLLPAGARPAGGSLDGRAVNLPDSVEGSLRATAARHRVTLNTMLHAAWALVLQRYSGDAEVTFGVTSSCRPPELPHVDRMLGLFTNTLPFRVPVPADGDLGPWLQDIQTRYVQVRRYEYSPLAQIKQWIGAPGAQPLFDSLFIFDNYPLSIELGDLGEPLSIRPVDMVEKTSVPLVVLVTPEPKFTLRVKFHEERFAPGVADDIFASFQAALVAIAVAERIGDVAEAVAAAAAKPRATPPRRTAEPTLFSLVARQAAATPDAPAVVADDGALSYRAVLERATRTGAALRAAGVGPGDVVGVCTPRSLDLVTGVLGALAAGAAYLPLEPSLPAARLAFMVREAGAELVLARHDTAGLAADAGARRVLVLGDLPPAPADPGNTAPDEVRGTDAAYVMFTSGSTGQPKGVIITHEAIVNRLRWMQDTFALTPADRVLQKTPFGFDVSVWELFWPLMTGATMVLARPDGHQDAEYLARVIQQQQITTAHFVPSMLQLYLDEPVAQLPSALTRVLCSGEELPPTLVRRFQAARPEVALHNLYGPTEAAVDVTWWDCSRPAPPDVVPIGDVITNTQAYVLDRRLMEAPVNVPGELYLGGVQLARGYVNRPGLTAATFVAHPLAGPGGRLYRTGDKVSRRPDGSLHFLGRLDRQVKVHGYRIELGEIEQQLATHPSVREAAVVARSAGGGQHLAAYVTALDGSEPDPRSLREHLQRLLPAYMVPATITVLPAMPLTHNGKLDRAALAEPDAAPRGPAGARVAAAATPQEEAVAAVFGEVLGLADVDVTASFFELGGSSFDAVRAIRRIEGATVGLLAAHPSVRQLVTALTAGDDLPSILLRLSAPSTAAHTLLCVPFGGGSAISYQPLARSLPPGLELLAVAVPGHEFGTDSELRPLEEVAQEAAEAVLKVTDGPISVYGHCAGVALAVELTRQIELAGRPVQRLFVAGSYPFYDGGPVGRALQRGLGTLVSRGVLRVSAFTVGLSGSDTPGANQAEMRYLQSIGGFDGVVGDDELAFVMRAFRHDIASAIRYFTHRWSRDSDTPPLAAPITFIAGTDDPLTPKYERRVRLWNRFGPAVELATVPGGHYFHQQHPQILADIIRSRIPVAEAPSGVFA